ADLIGVRSPVVPVDPPAVPRFAFGQNFAVDLLALYAIHRTGDVAAAGLARDIPDHAVQAALRTPMTFMERANPTLYENFPRPLMPGLAERLGDCGIGWYTESDWQSFATIRRLLAPYHARVQGPPAP